MRTIVLAAICMAWVSTALSQTGPSPPHLVVSALADQPMLMRHAKGEALRAIIDLAVDASGHVTSVTIVESSGDEDFDARLREYYSKLRLVPKLDEHGTAIAGIFTMRVGYKRAEGSGRVHDPNRPKFTGKDPREERVYDEAERIGRMSCKDFLWEFDLMKDIAGSKLKPMNEQLVRTSLAMFISHDKPSDEAVKKLGHALDAALRDTVKQCRAKPEMPYFSGAFAPTLTAQTAR